MTPDVKCDICDEFFSGPVGFYKESLVCSKCLEDLEKDMVSFGEKPLLWTITILLGGFVFLTPHPIFLPLFLIFLTVSVFVTIIFPYLDMEG